MTKTTKKAPKGEPKKRQDNRVRHYCVRTYLNEQTIKATLEKNLSIIYRWAYAKHDKDIKRLEDGTEQPKAEHIHLVLWFKNKMSLNQVATLFPGEENGVKQATHTEKCATICGSIRYLVHYDDIDKHQYDLDSIKHCESWDSILDYFDYDKVESTEVLIIQDMLAGVPLRDIMHKYKRDFILHYIQYKRLYEDIVTEDTSRMIRYNRVTSEDFFGGVQTLALYDKKTGEFIE